MQNTVTNRQMAFMLFIALTTSTAASVANAMAMSARHGAWLTLLISSLIFGAMAAVIIKLNQLHEGKILYQYSRELTGNFVAFLIGVFYLLYFFLISLFLCNSFDSLIKSSFLTKTPVWAMLLSGLPIYGTIAYKGIRNVGRLAEIIGLIYLIVSVAVFLSMLFQGTFSFALPLYYPPDTGKYLSAIKDTGEHFLGIEILLMIPFMKADKKMPKTVMLSVLGTGLFYILDVYGCYVMIGMEEIAYYKFPLVAAIRMVEYPKIEFLQRMDVVYDTIGFMHVFLGKSIAYLMSVELLCKMIPKANRLIVVIAVGAVIFLGSLTTSHIPDIMRIFASMLKISGFAVAFVIPLILLLMTKVEKNEKKSG